MRAFQQSLAAVAVAFSMLAATEAAAQRLPSTASAAQIKEALMKTKGIRTPAPPSVTDAIPRASPKPGPARRAGAAPQQTPAHKHPAAAAHASASRARPAPANPSRVSQSDPAGGEPADFQILFDRDSAELRNQARTFLDTLAEQLNSSELKAESFVIEGHTDAVGSDAYNRSLSDRRAQAVRAYLIEQRGVDPQRLEAVGKGKSELANPAAPASEINRRVRFVNRGAG